MCKGPELITTCASFLAGLRFEFGQTTLEGHSLAGEERFSVQWCKEDDSVWWVQLGLVPAAQLECHC